MTTGLLAVRQFSFVDQEAFARWSGDFNPMHMNALAARRTQAGACVVHGMHTVLWALDCLASAGEPVAQLASLKAQFNKFVYLDREIALTVARRSDDSIKLALTDDGLTVSTLTLKYGPRDKASGEPLRHLPPTALGRVPLEPKFEAMSALSGRLMPSPHAPDLAEHFPHLCAALGKERVIGLALTSTLVGMACPGLHSMFSGFSISIVADDDNSSGLSWRTERTDERFRMVWLRIAGLGLTGEVSSWVRAEPVILPDMSTLSSLVAPDEFAGRVAVIVGGSRGLGAVTAKLLAAGGAQILITYASGKADAEALISEIRTARGEKAAACIACDVRGDIGSQLAALTEGITHFYYFATPRISRQTTAVFDRAAFDEFMRFYVEGFYALAKWLIDNRRTSLRNIFYPSSVFVTSRPGGMTEYAMAKAAAEILCADLMKATPGLSIAAPQIPRVLTDQTATVPPVETADAIGVMLPLLRAENGP
ncbi:MAG TPA: SDR family NAD(P)-dependent oxidoreductase [Micropepsaceae bacterium]|nr:SDR family NAD(P)-dependent oxidoreductase [Micropepsaceae bacterium]